MTESRPSAFAALKGHPLFRVATIYAVAGWLLIQFADISLETFESPPWIMQTFLVLVLAGFPLTLTSVWLVERARQDRPTASLASMLTILMAAALSGAGYVYFNETDSNADVAREPGDNGVRVSNPVLAVLPFANMSNVEENEYLADGMTEDVITLLAQSPGVEVIARNSTFKYKGTNPDIRDVASDLGADYVIEGSIRPVGDRIRVTVQVIEAASGAHIWAEKYDRPLSQFFEVQDEVSMGVAAASGDAIFREEYKALNQSRTENLSAWALTSQADVGFNFSHHAGDDALIMSAREATRLDPDYALAHAVLARQLAINSLFFGGTQADADEALARARRAERLAPDDPKVLACLAITLLWTHNPVEALSVANRVIEMSPSYAEGLVYYADILTHNGRSRDGLPYFEKAIRLTPNAPQLGMYLVMQGEAFMHHGDFTAAEAPLREGIRIMGDTNPILLRYLAGTQLRLGRMDAAKTAMMRAERIDGRSMDDERKTMALYSTDNGGESFGAVWNDLAALRDNL